MEGRGRVYRLASLRDKRCAVDSANSLVAYVCRWAVSYTSHGLHTLGLHRHRRLCCSSRTRPLSSYPDYFPKIKPAAPPFYASTVSGIFPTLDAFRRHRRHGLGRRGDIQGPGAARAHPRGVWIFKPPPSAEAAGGAGSEVRQVLWGKGWCLSAARRSRARNPRACHPERQAGFQERRP
jgi:hypothetical protein